MYSQVSGQAVAFRNAARALYLVHARVVDLPWRRTHRHWFPPSAHRQQSYTAASMSRQRSPQSLPRELDGTWSRRRLVKSSFSIRPHLSIAIARLFHTVRHPEAPMTEPNPVPALDPEDRLRAMEIVRLSQRLVPALVAGSVAALAGTALWAVITVFTHHEIAWFAIGLGWLVGITVRWQGRGFERRYAILGATLAFLSVFIGKYFTLIGLDCQESGRSFGETLTTIPVDVVLGAMRKNFDPLDLLFYGLALWCGWKYSRREVSDDEIRQAIAK